MPKRRSTKSRWSPTSGLLGAGRDRAATATVDPPGRRQPDESGASANGASAAVNANEEARGSMGARECTLLRRAPGIPGSCSQGRALVELSPPFEEVPWVESF